MRRTRRERWTHQTGLCGRSLARCQARISEIEEELGQRARGVTPLTGPGKNGCVRNLLCSKDMQFA
jgi:hypothetical protein